MAHGILQGSAMNFSGLGMQVMFMHSVVQGVLAFD